MSDEVTKEGVQAACDELERQGVFKNVRMQQAKVEPVILTVRDAHEAVLGVLADMLGEMREGYETEQKQAVPESVEHRNSALLVAVLRQYETEALGDLRRLQKLGPSLIVKPGGVVHLTDEQALSLLGKKA